MKGGEHMNWIHILIAMIVGYLAIPKILSVVR